MICLEPCSASFMPCCEVCVHRSCLESMLIQDPNCSSSGGAKWIVRAPKAGGGTIPIPLATTHNCPQCKALVASTRGLVTERTRRLNL